MVIGAACDWDRRRHQRARQPTREEGTHLLLAFAFLGRATRHRELLLRQEVERSLLVRRDQEHERVETALSDEVRHALAGQVRKHVARRFGCLALRRVLGCQRPTGPQRHLREALVDCRNVSGAVLQDREQQVDEFDASARVLAQIDEHLLQQAALERVWEEQQANEGRQAGLVEQLNDFTVRGRFLGDRGFVIDQLDVARSSPDSTPNHAAARSDRRSASTCMTMPAASRWCRVEQIVEEPSGPAGWEDGVAYLRIESSKEVDRCVRGSSTSDLCTPSRCVRCRCCFSDARCGLLLAAQILRLGTHDLGAQCRR